MKDKTILLIRKWFNSKTGIDLMHDPSLISLVNEIEALCIHDVVGRSEQLCDLDGKTVLVKFKVTKHIPKIVIEDI